MCYNYSGDDMILRNKENRITYILKGLSAIFIYFLFSIYQNLPFEIMHIDVDNLPTYLSNIYSFSLEALMISIIFCIFEKEFKVAFEDIKKNHLTYFNKYLKVYLLGVIVMMLSNVCINALGDGLSANETVIRNEFQISPIYTFVSAVILAPLLEESVFRLSFKAIFKNDYLFLLASSLIFGGLHLIGTPISETFPLYLISYCSVGVSFAYMLNKTNNVLVTMGFHFMHNGLILAMQTFILIFA